MKKGVAPYAYWQRGQDCYVSVVSAVDQQIRGVLDAIPAEVLAKSVVVFCSDHGDYVGSHGFLQNKVGTGYAEALRVPLVVRDHTGRFAAEPARVRDGLTSSVDLLAATKLVTYSFWNPASTRFNALDRGIEFYDYSSEAGRAETDNRLGDPRVAGQLARLFEELLPGEVCNPLPASLTAIQSQQEQAWITYADLLDKLQDAVSLSNVHLSLGAGL